MEITTRYLDKVIAAARAVDLRQAQKAVDILVKAYRGNRSVFVIGNGGSAANASHFAQDLAKSAVPNLRGKRFKVLSLTDNIAFITAIANDIGYDRIFEIQLRQFAKRADVLVAISGSGNSQNIIAAVDYARKLRMTVIGLTGFRGGRLMKKADVKIHVPLNDMCKSEAVHSILLHMLVELVRDRLAR